MDNTAIQNPQGWINAWTTLVTAVSQDENTKLRLLISPLTNPDLVGMRSPPPPCQNLAPPPHLAPHSNVARGQGRGGGK